MARIAFIGLGRMGAGMAARLLAAGHEIVVHNRTSERGDALLAAGARWGNTPAEAAADADAVFVMVSDDDASRAVWLGPDGGAGPRQAASVRHRVLDALAQLGARTCGRLPRRRSALPRLSRDRFAGRGRGGSADAAGGGDGRDLAAARDVLAPLADQIVHFGGVGTAPPTS